MDAILMEGRGAIFKAPEYKERIIDSNKTHTMVVKASI
jgi:hypothetical protein